jgi:Trk K+ transport system NAD-binding subunit
MQANLLRVAERGGSTGIREIVVEDDSPLVDVALRSKVIPRGVLITAIERGRDVIRPTGATIFNAGDHLMVLGGPQDLEALEQLAASTQH